MKNVAYCMLGLAAIIAIWVFLGGEFYGNTAIPDPDKAKDLQPFMTGLIAPLLTLASALLVIENLWMTTRQNFSNNFFKLLDFHHKIVDGISDFIYGINDKPKVTMKASSPITFQNEELRLLYGYLRERENNASLSKPDKSVKRNFFSDLSWRICYDYNYIDSNGEPIANNYETKLEHYEKVKECVKGKSGENKLVAIYSYYFGVHREIISQYMEHLESIINYVEKYGINDEIKTEHYRLLAAQLSNYELAVIAYHYLIDFREPFKKIIDKIFLLKSTDFEDGLSAEYQRRFAAPDVIIAAYPLTFKGRKLENESSV